MEKKRQCFNHNYNESIKELKRRPKARRNQRREINPKKKQNRWASKKEHGSRAEHIRLSSLTGKLSKEHFVERLN